MRLLSWRQFLITSAFAFVFFALVFTPIAWTQLDRLMEAEKKAIWSTLETLIGEKIEYSRIAPNFLEALEFRDVKVSRPDGSSVLRAASIRLRIDWLAVLSGRFDTALQKLQVINGVFDLQESRDADLVDHVRKLLSEVKSPVEGVSTQIEGFNLSGVWKGLSGEWSMERGFVVFGESEGDYQIQMRGTLRAAFSDPSLPLKTVEGSFKGELRTDRSFTKLTLQGRSSRIVTDLADIEPLQFQMNVDPDAIVFNKVQDRVPLDLKVVWNRRDRLLNAQLQAVDFRFNNLVHWKGDKTVADWLDTSWNGTMAFGLRTDRQEWDLNVQGRAEFNNPLLPHGSQIHGVLTGSPTQVVFHDAWFETPEIQVGFNGSVDLASLLPDGLLTVKHLEMPQIGRSAGTVTFQRSGNEVRFSCPDLQWQSFRFGETTGSFERSGDFFAYDLKTTLNALTTAQFSFQGKGNFSEGRFPLEFSIRDFPVSSLAKEWDFRGLPGKWPEETQKLLWQANGRMTWGKSFSLFPSHWEFADPQHTEHRGSFSLEFVDQVLSIAEIDFHWDSAALLGKAKLNFGDSARLVWDSDWQIFGKSLQVGGDYLWRRHRLTWGGPSGIEGQYQFGDDKSWLIKAEVKDFPLPNEATLGFSWSAEGQADTWDGVVKSFSIKARYPWNASPFDAEIEGKMNSKEINLSKISIADHWGALQGSLTSSWDFLSDTAWKGEMTLHGDGPEQWVGQWSLKGLQEGRIDFGISQGLLQRFFAEPLTGRFETNADFQWGNQGWQWNLRAALSEARWGNDPLGLRFNARGDRDGVFVSDLQGALNPVQINNGKLSFFLREKKWSTATSVLARLGSGVWKSDLLSEGTWLDHADGAPTIQLQIRTSENSWAEKPFPDWILNGHYENGQCNAKLSDGALLLSGDDQGRFHAESNSNFAALFVADGKIKDGIADLDVSKVQVDLKPFAEALSSPLFQVKEGIFRGDFKVSGPINDPQVNGAAQIQGLAFNSLFIRQTVGPFDCPLQFQGKLVQVPLVNAGTAGQFWMLRGALILDHALPEEFEFSVETAGLSLVPVAYKFTGLDAQGWVSGLLVVKGTPVSAVLSAKLLLQSTSITLANDQTSDSTSDSYGINVDLQLTTGRKVEFIWPNATLPLVRTIAATGQTLVIHTNDAASTFSINGKIDLKAGEINYLSQVFQVRGGSLTFQENQNHFDPHLTVRADLKKREASGNVVINLRADDALSRFSPRFDSTPYKSPEELQQLIGSTLALPSNYSKSTDLGTAISLASDLGTGFILRPFEESVKKNLGLDLFTVSTEILKRSLLNRNAPLEASAYLDNTRIFFGKYLGDDLFLQGTLNFQQDTTTANLVTPRLIVEPEIQMEFQTPFFLLNWTLLPQHPETLFVTDNTVTFSWDWSY